MDWEDLRHFAGFVEAGSLSAAARRLGVEHATVARRIAALEAALGLKLVDRRGRRLVLTTHGERVAALAGEMEGCAAAVDRLAAGAKEEIVGEVTLSVPPAYGARVLAPRLARLRRAHPGLVLHLLGETRTAALERREADLAVRLGRPEAGDLVALKLVDLPFRLYASPAYLAATPPEQRCLVGHEGVMAGSPQQRALERQAPPVEVGFVADQVEMVAALVRAGAGVSMLPDFLVENDAGFAAVPPGEVALTREAWLVMHADLRRSAPVRAVVAALKA